MPASRQFVLDGLGDESTPIALDSVDLLDEVGGERHGHACGFGHGVKSMTQNMIILKLSMRRGPLIPRHFTVSQESSPADASTPI